MQANVIMQGHSSRVRAAALASGLLAMLATAGTATGQGGAPATPILITFVIHFDPLPNRDGRVLRKAYEAERDNIVWLRDLLSAIEQDQGRDFVPRVHLQMGGEQAEYYANDGRGMRLLKDLYETGLHTFGTHFHRSYRKGRFWWPPVGLEPRPGQPMLNPMTHRITQDHITQVETLIGKVIGSQDPIEIRQANLVVTGHLRFWPLLKRSGFTLRTGGVNELMGLFFEHDVYNPWRPAVGWPLAEELGNGRLNIPNSPPLGKIDPHFPIPFGVPDEVRQQADGKVWHDGSVPAMQRKFLYLYLTWRHFDRMKQDMSPADWQQNVAKVWTFGWHLHPNKLFGDDGAYGDSRQLRDELVEFIAWLGATVIGTTAPDGNPVARYAGIDEVRDAYLAWEGSHPGQSSFSYPVLERDWQQYPYPLKGLAAELMYSHYNGRIDAFLADGVQVHQLTRTNGPHWGFSNGQTVSSGPTEVIYLLWSDVGEALVDFSSVLPGPVVWIDGESGAAAVVDATALPVSEQPIVVRAP